MLVTDGHDVVAVDNCNDYYDVRLKAYRLHELARMAGAGEDVLALLRYTGDAIDPESVPPRIDIGLLHWRAVDIEDAAAVDALFDEFRIDAVLNLAARAGVRYSMENPQVYLSTNVSGLLNLLESMRTHEARKLVLASTSSLYAGQPMPFTEDQPVNTPISPYAASKKAAEVLSYTWHNLYDFDVSVVRYFTVFGPAGRPDMSPLRFLRWIDEGSPIQLFGDGSQSRDFTYIDDIARGSIAALRPLGYEIINLGGGNRPISIRQMIEWMEEMLGKKAVIEQKPFHKADMMETWADINRAEKLLEWAPQVDVREGFQLTADWYSANREWIRKLIL